MALLGSSSASWGYLMSWLLPLQSSHLASLHNWTAAGSCRQSMSSARVFVAAAAAAWCLLGSQSDYEAANYDVKKTKGYWQLGRLGPEETQELQAKVSAALRHSLLLLLQLCGASTGRASAVLQDVNRVQCGMIRCVLNSRLPFSTPFHMLASCPCNHPQQREARERVKELSKRISVENAQRLAAVGPARPRTKDPSARQRAVEYAKTSVPKPELLKQRSSSSGRRRGGSAPAAVAAGGAGGGSRQASQVGWGEACLRLTTTFRASAPVQAGHAPTLFVLFLPPPCNRPPPRQHCSSKAAPWTSYSSSMICTPSKLSRYDRSLNCFSQTLISN